ncbi:MAG: formylglycine-generating enzyme family protein [Phycisphaerae bacterium]|nr:formylglycine-generating enzyme family protein [Phycisphaerae bacterium]
MQRFTSRLGPPAIVLILGAAAAPLSAWWPADFDADSDVDLTDFSLFQNCFNGPNRPAPWPWCNDADLDDDTDVDLSDFSIFAACFNGPNRPPACEPEPAPANMVLIPAGEFQMGDTFNEGNGDELPVHAVYVDAFYMDKYEVSNQQYADALNWAYGQGGHIAVTSGGVYQAGTGTSYPYCDTTTSNSYSRITWDGGTFGVTTGKEDHPMVMVSWYGSVAYANWRSAMEGKALCYNLATWECNFSASGYRLPTEAEWEKAARGGVAGHRFPWSDSDTIQHARANYYSYWPGGVLYYPYDTNPTSGFHPTFAVGDKPYTSPVGYFAPNGYGLYDMAGNVWEWCNDWYSSTYYSTTPYPHVNPRGPTSGMYRVLRSGGWCGTAYHCRVANRISYYSWPDSRDYGNGFRLVLVSP